MSTQDAESRSLNDTAAVTPDGNELETRYDELIDFMFQITKRQAEWEEQQNLLADQQKALGSELQKRCADFAAERKQLNEEREELQKQRRRLDKIDLDREVSSDGESETGLLASELIERLTKLEMREDKIEEKLRVLVNLEQRTRQQRRAIALQLRAQKAELAVQRQSSAASATSIQSVEKLEESLKSLKVESDEKIAALQVTLAMSYDRQAELETDLLKQSTSITQLQQRYDELNDEAGKLVADNEELRARAHEMQSAQQHSGESSDAEHLSIIEELRETIDVANEKIDRLRNENDLLIRQLDDAGPNSSVSLQTRDGVADEQLDWEAEKARLLNELESDQESDHPELQQQRRSIEEIISKTDSELTRKDEEIEELKRMLNQQSDRIGDVAVGAAAISEIFDQDEVISQQRDELNHLQEEWKEKLRKAEVEISMERAKLARDRAVLEERLSEAQGNDENDQTRDDAKDDKHGRGKWLTRLGLRDEE